MTLMTNEYTACDSYDNSKRTSLFTVSLLLTAKKVVSFRPTGRVYVAMQD